MQRCHGRWSSRHKTPHFKAPIMFRTKLKLLNVAFHGLVLCKLLPFLDNSTLPHLFGLFFFFFISQTYHVFSFDSELFAQFSPLCLKLFSLCPLGLLLHILYFSAYLLFLPKSGVMWFTTLWTSLLDSPHHVSIIAWSCNMWLYLLSYIINYIHSLFVLWIVLEILNERMNGISTIPSSKFFQLYSCSRLNQYQAAYWK